MPRRSIYLLLAAAFAAIVGLPLIVRLATDWFWFQSLGLEPVFLTSLGTKLALGVVAGLVAFGVFYANLRYAQRGAVPHPVLFALEKGGRPFDLTGLFRRLAGVGAFILAGLFGLAAPAAWLTVIRFLNQVPFGVADPIFQRDLGYYFFSLPALSTLLGFVSALGLLSLLLVVPLYVLRGDLLVRRRVSVEPSAQLHIAALIALLLLTTAARIYLVRIPSLLYQSSEARFLGASFADLAVRLPFLRVEGVVALLGGVVVLWGAFRRRLVLHLAVSLGALVGLGLLAGGAASVVHRFVVLPNELEKETPQLRHNIAATRAAWGLDRVDVRDLTGEAQLTLQDIRNNGATIENVRLWDRDPVLQTLGQLQEIRTYYDFVSVDDDRYVIDGTYRQVMVAPRELNVASLPTRNFINERLTFTHGMGVTLAPVNQVTEEGLPVLFIQDLPPASRVSLSVTRPGIYYGELSGDYVFVHTGQPEFDYPSGDDNTFARYAGSGGVPVRSFFRRLALAIRFGEVKILLSNDITSESRVMFYRNIRERAARALPFFRWDGDPYMVIRDDGRLAWILDGYTASDRYPYAQPLTDGVNYLRNAVKVVIDAYDGSVAAYIADDSDPIIRTYAAAFPGVFRPLSELAPDLRAHLRYPEDLFRAQTAVYTTYHMDEPEVFYHREDQWQIPTLPSTGNQRDPFLRHLIMKLPGEQREEFIFMMPFTPRQKDNLAAWMVARNDGEHYGRLIVYRFPRQSLVFGPTQVLNRINQQPEISQQIALWDQRGSQVIRGSLLVIPIEQSLIYVQPIYLRAEGGRIPEMRRVIVAYRNQVVMEETLDQGLTRLFGGSSDPPGRTQVREPVIATGAAADGGSSVAELARQAADHYERAIAAQRQGNWGAYGEEIARVGEILRRIRGNR